MGKRKQVFLLRVKFFRVRVFFTRSLSQMLVGLDKVWRDVSRGVPWSVAATVVTLHQTENNA